MSILVKLISLCLIIVETSGQQKAHQEELEKFRPLESYVDLKGGEFFMGINDREGVNGEYPHKKAIVQPFRY